MTEKKFGDRIGTMITEGMSETTARNLAGVVAEVLSNVTGGDITVTDSEGNVVAGAYSSGRCRRLFLGLTKEQHERIFGHRTGRD